MKVVANIMVVFVAVQHVAFLVLEIFYWNKPLGLKVFKLEQSFANASHSLAMNQGLYNGFLASGLLWALLTEDAAMAYQLKLFFLGCIIIAAIFGSLTVGKFIIVVQGVPAFIAFLLVFFYLKVHNVSFSF